MSLKPEPKAGWGDTSGDAASPARLSGSGGSKARATRLPHGRAAGFTWSSHNMNGDPTGVIFSILAYSFCSSTMLVVNKVAVGHIRVPTAVSGTQLCFTSAFVLLLHCTGVSTLGKPSRRALQPFAVYTTTFAVGVYANIKALELTSVGAVIAARSCLPLAVAALEWAFMGRQLPSARSSVALAGVLAAAYVYVRTDTTLGVEGSAGAAWLLFWWCLLAFQMTYGKHLTVAVEMSETERVFYNNALSLPPTAALCFVMGEHRDLGSIELSPLGFRWLLLSCVIGVGISYTGWRLKDLVSATTFTLVGVLNKMATIALSALAFPGTASMQGCAALVACITFGLAYKDAPLRSSLSTRGVGKARDSNYVSSSAALASPVGGAASMRAHTTDAV